MVSEAPIPRRTWPLALRHVALLLVAAGALAFVAALISDHTIEGRADDRSGALRFASVLADRAAPHLAHDDHQSLQTLALTARDLAGHRVVILDSNGRVRVDTAYDRTGEPLGLAAGVRGRQRTLSSGELETLVPARFGGVVVGEVRLRLQSTTPQGLQPSWTRFATFLLLALTLLALAGWSVHHLGGHIRRAARAVFRLMDGAPAALPDGLPPGRELQELREALLDLDRAMTRGADRVASSLLTMAVHVVDVLESRGQATPGHGERTARYAELLAQRVGISPAERRDLDLAARLHELGKLWVRPSILCKKGPLTSMERESFRQYPLKGADAFEGLPSLRGVAAIIRHHQERWDGGGFPEGLRGDRIPLGARILAIAAAYDQLTAPDFQGEAVRWDEALTSMAEDRGVHFDPELLDLFAEEIRKAPMPEPQAQHEAPAVALRPYKAGEEVEPLERLDDDELEVLTIEDLEVMFEESPDEEGR